MSGLISFAQPVLKRRMKRQPLKLRSHHGFGVDGLACVAFFGGFGPWIH